MSSLIQVLGRFIYSATMMPAVFFAMRKYAIFIDGAFAIHKLDKINQPQKFPDFEDILNLIDSIGRHPVIGRKFHLLRTYFYHAHPAKGVIKKGLIYITRQRLLITELLQNLQQLLSRQNLWIK